MDGLVWVALGSSLLFAWAAIKLINSKKITDEAVFRVQHAPHWQELTSLRRRLMWLLDWPLFVEIREREVARLINQPLMTVRLKPWGVILAPVEVPHTAPYFLTRIASAAGSRGLKVRYNGQGIFGPHWAGTKEVKLTWSGSDERIWGHVRNELSDGELVSLRRFRDIQELAYLSTLSPEQTAQYYRENR
ncbi:MAG: hypothetical protein CL951_03455 [Erythrobacteraceae bacterium]|nr:hypothetical protein [Erythrobacteraceae bacterium]